MSGKWVVRFGGSRPLLSGYFWYFVITAVGATMATFLLLKLMKRASSRSSDSTLTHGTVLGNLDIVNTTPASGQESRWWAPVRLWGLLCFRQPRQRIKESDEEQANEARDNFHLHGI